jgi:sulfite reductase alpha subunit-like flavoprotein
MKVPAPNVPSIFVGPGTGIAPMRAMIEERVHQGAKGNALKNSTDSDNLLVFGNRNRTKDFLFEQEWNKLQSSHGLSVLLAFSRDGPADEKKLYVQDVIQQHGTEIYDYLIRRKGTLYISGSSGKMPQGVKDAVIEIIKVEQGVTREDAQQIQASLEKTGRWKQETW